MRKSNFTIWSSYFVFTHLHYYNFRELYLEIEKAFRLCVCVGINVKFEKFKRSKINICNLNLCNLTYLC